DGEIRHRLSVERVLPARRRIKQSKDGKQGRLAAARWPRNRNVLPLLDLQVNLRQSVRLHLVGVKHLLNAFHLDECCACLCHFLSFLCSKYEIRFTCSCLSCPEKQTLSELLVAQCHYWINPRCPSRR